jgi:hypothetical protein
MNNNPNKLKPVLIAAGLMIIISITPFISAINVFCCAGIIIGALIGTFSYYKDLQKANLLIDYKDGVMIGILAGIITAIVYTGFVLIIQLYSEGNMFTDIANDFEKLGFQLSPEFYKAMDYFSGESNSYGFSPTLTIVSLALYLILFPLFGALGGLFGVSIFKKKQQSLSA